MAELLRYLCDHEEFLSIEKLLGGDVSAGEAKAVLRELSTELAKEAASEAKTSYDVKGCKNLSKSSKNIISSLSPREEKSLLTAFGLIEKKQS